MSRVSSGWGIASLGVFALVLGVLASTGCAPERATMAPPVTGDAVQQAWI